MSVKKVKYKIYFKIFTDEELVALHKINSDLWKFPKLFSVNIDGMYDRFTSITGSHLPVSIRA